MPLHDHRCGEGHVFERFVPLAELELTQTCECGARAERIFLQPPMTAGDLPGYESPVTGEWIEGKAARRNDLAKNDCVAWEPGMREENQRRRDSVARKEEASIDHAFESTLAEMPARKKEKLEQELRAGASAEVVRGSPKGV